MYPKKEILLCAGSRVGMRAYHPGQARSCALDFLGFFRLPRQGPV